MQPIKVQILGPIFAVKLGKKAKRCKKGWQKLGLMPNLLVAHYYVACYAFFILFSFWP